MTTWPARLWPQDPPRDLYEAAEIDGAGHFRIYRSIALPLSAPSIAAVAIVLFALDDRGHDQGGDRAMWSGSFSSWRRQV